MKKVTKNDVITDEQKSLAWKVSRLLEAKYCLRCPDPEQCGECPVVLYDDAAHLVAEGQAVIRALLDAMTPAQRRRRRNIIARARRWLSIVSVETMVECLLEPTPCDKEERWEKRKLDSVSVEKMVERLLEPIPCDKEDRWEKRKLDSKGGSDGQA